MEAKTTEAGHHSCIVFGMTPPVTRPKKIPEREQNMPRKRWNELCVKDSVKYKKTAPKTIATMGHTVMTRLSVPPGDRMNMINPAVIKNIPSARIIL